MTESATPWFKATKVYLRYPLSAKVTNNERITYFLEKALSSI